MSHLSANSSLKTDSELTECLRKEGVLLTNELIGTGTYSTVYVGYYQNSRQVAVKIIDTKTKSHYVQKFMPRELQLIKLLNHPNIVKFYQTFWTHDYLAMVQEYGVNGDLLKLVKKTGFIEETESRFLFRQIMEALTYLEKLNIVHRDLKCENIFLDLNNNVKLGDFGFARVLNSNEISHTHCGSRAYVAVELLRGESYSGNSIDIWSSGVVLFIILTGRMPYNDKKPRVMVEQQLKHRIRFPHGIGSPEARDLIRHMLHPRRELRATLHDILSSEWLKNCRYYIRDHYNELKYIVDPLPMSTATELTISNV